MDTIKLVESLIYKNPDIRKVMMALNIVNIDRKISPTNHSEFNNILKNFENPKIISCVGMIQLTVLIEPKKINRTYPTIFINGYNSEIKNVGKTFLIKELNKYMNIKDFLPPAFIRKIIYIDNYKKKDNNNNENKIDGVVFSEYSKNLWTLGNPLDFEINNSLKTTPREILSEILNDCLE